MTIWNSDNTQVEKYDGTTWGPMGIAGVRVRKNSQMPVLGTRPQLNFIEGASIGLNLEDNPPDDEIDITVHAKYPTRFITLIPDDAAEAVPATETKAELASVIGTSLGYESLDFDPGAEEVAYWGYYLTPDYLSENIVVDIYWITTDAETAHNAKFGFSTLGREKGEAWDAILGTERTVVCPNGGDGVLNKARITTFAPGWSPGDVILFKLARKAAADDVDQDARVLKVVVSYTGQFAQSFYPLPEPVKLTLTAASAWTDMDVSAYVPVGATGVILHIVNKDSPPDYAIGLRKKGSTDNRTEEIHRVSHFWAMIGVDENRKFQSYVGDTTEIEIYLVGYTATGVVFFDNAYDKTPGVTNSWQDIDLSAECPGAIGVIVEITASAPTYNDYGLRKYGSTDNRYEGTEMHNWAIIGCDTSQVMQAFIGHAAGCDISGIFIVGYVTQGAVFKTNANDKSLAEIGDWTEIDCSTEAPKAIMLFFDVHRTGFHYRYGIRKKGSTENIYQDTTGEDWAMVACDSQQKVEGKIEDVKVDFFLVGYATWAGA
ncbi:hypothetical protein ES705_42784 [subsurface metagenome]